MSISDRNAASAAVDMEETDLHRRVLAHERILQVLIAELAAGDPGIMSRLSAAFGGRRGSQPREHDDDDTRAYAGEFLPEVGRLVAEPVPRQSEGKAAAPAALQNDQAYSSVAPVVVLRVEHRRLIWEVTRDGDFYGHYCERLSALDAAVAAATAITAQAGRADVVLEQDPSAADRRVHDRGASVPRSTRTVQFRPPATVTTATASG